MVRIEGSVRGRKILEHKINRAIHAPIVRVIDQDGVNLGDLPISKALEKASQYDLDLVEIVSTVVPPICKILDYGTFIFQNKKKQSAAKKKNKPMKLKTVQFGILISVHDFNTKKNSIVSFLQDGCKVRVVIKFRRKQILHQDAGMSLANKIISAVAEYANVEQAPTKEEKAISITLAPNRTKNETTATSNLPNVTIEDLSLQ